jgi:hypothetical protein
MNWDNAKKRRVLSLSAFGVNRIVGCNFANWISSPKGTLFVTILSFLKAVSRYLAIT